MAKQTRKVNTTHYLYVEMMVTNKPAKYRLNNWWEDTDHEGKPCYRGEYRYLFAGLQRYPRNKFGIGLFPVKDIISKRIRKIKRK